MQENQPERAAIYARVSTGHDEISISAQLAATRDYAAGNGLEVVKEYTGAGGNRDQFEEMVADATQENPPFQHILVYDLSRFSRNLEEFQAHQERLEANGVTLTSVIEPA